MRLLTLRSVTHEGVINRNVWFSTQNRQTWYGCKSACSVCGIATRGVLNYCALQVVIFKIGTGHIEIGIVIGKRFWLHGKFFFISIVHFNY